MNCIAYGYEDNSYYAQVVCNKEHDGSECECRGLGTFETLTEAITRAKEASKMLNLPIVSWMSVDKPGMFHDIQGLSAEEKILLDEYLTALRRLRYAGIIREI